MSQAASRQQPLVATRDLIFAAAERLFAGQGFAATSIDAVAARVGVTRQAVIHHFGSKRHLYDRVLRSVFGGLVEVVGEAIASAATPTERLEAGVDAWIAYAVERPSAVRLYLREVASSQSRATSPLRPYSDELFELLYEIVADGRRAGEFGPVDPLHLVTMFVGSTLLFIDVLPDVGPDPSFGPSSAARVAQHRAIVLDNIRHLVNPGSPRRS